MEGRFSMDAQMKWILCIFGNFLDIAERLMAEGNDPRKTEA
jgi:hypothetical protein